MMGIGLFTYYAYRLHVLCKSIWRAMVEEIFFCIEVACKRNPLYNFFSDFLNLNCYILAFLRSFTDKNTL